MTTRKERGLILKDWEVRAIREGRKTRLTRVVGPQPISPGEGAYFDAYNGGPQWNWWAPDNRQYLSQIIRCPFGQPGDFIWVRETWQRGHCLTCDEGITGFECSCDDCSYRADYSESELKEGSLAWSSSATMPRWASRLTLEVVSVGVSRLQEISGEHALSEGVEVWMESLENDGIYNPDAHLRGYPITAFSRCWDTDHAKPGETWADNPWVWNLNFKRIEKK